MKRLLPILALACLAGAAALAPRVPQLLRVDSSTDSLVLESDPDAVRYDRTSLMFTSDEFVLVGLTRDDLFTPAGVAAVSSLHQQLASIEGVQGVESIVSVPLFRSYREQISPFQALMQERSQNGLRLTSPLVDLEKAKQELTDHELAAGNLVSEDGRTAGVLVTLRTLPASVEAMATKLRLLDRKATAQERLAASEGATREAAAAELAAVEAELAAFWPTWVATEDARKQERIRIVRAVREVVATARAAGADSRASGVPAIVVEMVEAIEGDLRVFLGLSAAFLCVFLTTVFRRPRWVVLPLLVTSATALATVGFMNLRGTRMTVITSNVPSLLLVIGLAHSIHMIVRYREYLVRFPELDPAERVLRVARSLFWPCLFTATTTCAGFLSLYFAGSRPIIDFGVAMTVGVLLALALSFVILPGALMVLPQGDQGSLERSARALEGLARASLRRGKLVVGAAVALTALSVWGISKIAVEARFIDYFSPSSPIHRGLEFIDQRLGGTSGLEVILTSDEPGAFAIMNPEGPARLDAAADVVAWLEARREVGAVMSYVGYVDELRKLVPGAKRSQAATLALQALDAEALRAYVVTHEVSVGGRTIAPFSGLRIVARARETDPELDRAALLADLRAFLAERFPADGAVQAEVSGMFVLYNNMLQSLVGSQVVSSLVALGAIWLMLALLFRNPFAALLALVPNLLPITVVMGAMGWVGIPLDMATVMIASVSLGIGVDCAIHYLFRYREEVARDGDVAGAIARSHGSIGTSIFWTALTTVVGFSVLVFSAILPNAYFGAFTAFAMIAALFAMLTLLPVLIAWTRPFGAATRAGAASRPSPPE